jgi:acetyl-CoA C-acetyltransferase
MIKDVYLTGGVRTAIGSFCGAFENTPTPALGGVVLRAALARAGVQPNDVDEVIFGNVVAAGLGQNVARQVAIGAGLAPSIGATTVNKVCGSGLKSVMLAAQAIQCGDASLVVAGGTENMSRAPYLLEKARGGYRMGNGELVDSMIRDGLWDVYNGVHMGTCGDRCAEKYGFTREQQDDYAVTSFQRAIKAVSEKHFADEIEPVQVKAGREIIVVAEDETPKKFNEEKLRKLRPAFGERT